MSFTQIASYMNYSHEAGAFHRGARLTTAGCSSQARVVHARRLAFHLSSFESGLMIPHASLAAVPEADSPSRGAAFDCAGDIDLDTSSEGRHAAGD
jgi:hypothetical protein